MELSRTTDFHSSGLSVALCTYNGERYLPEQLDSIRKQDYLPTELVACDDGSTDATVGLLEDFARDAPFPVRIVRNARNTGSTRNFEQAVGLCRGEYISFCDQDDVWLCDKLSSCVDFLQTHPLCLAVFTDATLVDQALCPLAGDSSLWGRIGLTPDLLARLTNPATSLQMLSGPFFVTGATLMARRELVRCALPIPAEMPSKMLHDGWFAVLAATLGGLGALSQPTMFYRQHPAQQVGISQDFSHQSSIPREKFRRLAIDLGHLHDLLFARTGARGVPGVLDELKRRTDHFRRRGDLPAERLRRIRPVLEEWRRGNYHSFCRYPSLSALRDIAG